MEELHKYIFSAVSNLRKFVVPCLKTLHSGHYSFHWRFSALQELGKVSTNAISLMHAVEKQTCYELVLEPDSSRRG